MTQIRTDELGMFYTTIGKHSLPLRRSVPDHCCPYCGEPVGYLGNLLAWFFGADIHGCDSSNVMHPQEFWNERERRAALAATVSETEQKP